VSLPDGYALRPIVPGSDLEAVAGLVAACDVEDVGRADQLTGWIVQTWKSPSLRGAWLVQDADGEPAAYLELESEDPTSAFESFCPVHPRHREGPLRLGLLRFLRERARELAGGPETILRLAGAAHEPGLERDAQAAGFAHARVFWHMVRDLDPREGRGDPPPGVTIRAARDPDDDHAIHEVLDEAFRGHFGAVPMTFERFLSEFKDDLYDASLVAIAELDGRPVGVAACWIVDGVGWIGDLGVLADARGRGIGAALLRAAFATLAARGLTRVRLNVDSDNETGATRLYEGVGMTVHRAFDVYETRLTDG
jgi:mycothiol synthase